MKNSSICILSVLVFISCTNNNTDELLDAPEQVNIGAYTFDLSATILDPAPFESGLSATVSIFTVDSSDFPQWLDADEIWVISGNNVWHDDLVPGTTIWLPWMIVKENQHTGPNWNAGVYVDVVVQLIDDTDNTYLIRESDVYILGC